MGIVVFRLVGGRGEPTQIFRKQTHENNWIRIHTGEGRGGRPASGSTDDILEFSSQGECKNEVYVSKVVP